jgi:hypothetical protein
VYAELAKSLPPADRLALRNDERSWLRTRDSTCGVASSQGNRTAWFADLLRDYQKTVCVVRLTNERVALDLDNGRLSISESGLWPNGDPGSAGGDSLIPEPQCNHPSEEGVPSRRQIGSPTPTM